MKEKVDSQLIVIFGASGDLTGRKLIPSLYELHKRDLLPERLCVLGASRTEYTDEDFRKQQRVNVEHSQKGRELKPGDIDAFLEHISYVSFDSADSSEYHKLKDRITEMQAKLNLPDKVIYYLATPPLMYDLIPQYLQENSMTEAGVSEGWRRIVIEKPFGTSLESAKALNKKLMSIFDEKEIYRIDHYLGKETVQNILVLRFSNGIFEPLWNRNYVDSVEISVSETLGVENRGKYYEGAGAMRDMIQNHLMQLMGFIAMESPAVFDAEPLRDEIVKVFRSLRPYGPTEIDLNVVRGQYDGYRQEPQVAPDSTTETYAAMKLYIDNWRWAGVPFYLNTGKKLLEKKSEIVINFKTTPNQLFIGQCSGTSCNKLTISIQPNEGISLQFGLKMPGAGFEVKQVSMDFKYESLSKVYLPDAYERLLLDAMLGDSTLYARSDALEASWRFIDPILEHWKVLGEKNLFPYTSGSNGPEERCPLKIQPRPCDCYSKNKRF